MKRTFLFISLSLFLTCILSNITYATDKIERTEWDKSPATACSKALDKARLAVNSHCHWDGGVKEAIGGGCVEKNVSEAWNGRPMFAATVTFSVTCNGK